MGALSLRKLNQDIDNLSVQMDMCPTVLGKQRAYIETFLRAEGITDLSMITEEVKAKYRLCVLNDFSLSSSQKNIYRNSLEPLIMYYLMPEYPIIAETIIHNDNLNRCIRNKIGTFLMENNIQDPAEIDYGLRIKFEERMTLTIASSKVAEYVKVLDQIKLDCIKKENERTPLRKHELSYDGTPLFLAYHPNYEKALIFYYSQDKKILVYDFYEAKSKKICVQIVDFLNYVFREITESKLLHDLYLAPLHKFFNYCVDNGITDIELMESDDIKGYRTYIKGKVGTKETEYIQIVNSIQKYLFCSNPSIRWEANNWYLDRFTIKSGRLNPARSISRLSFWEIRNAENRQLFKNYMAYSLGLTDKAISNVRENYYRINEFLKFCDEKNFLFINMNKNIMDEYACYLSSQEIKENTFNQKIIAIFQFWNYWFIKGKVNKPCITSAFYLRKSYSTHNELSVSADTIHKVIVALKKAKKHIQYMYLLLLETGCRICEVCSIRATAFIRTEKASYMRIYEPKMKREKQIPIPDNLYVAMNEYISEIGKSGDEYIFSKRDGGAYNADYFSKQVKRLLLDAGITKEEYNFRPHGYRHTLATRFYDAGISLQIVREYLDHNSEEMTKQYIDYNGRRCKEASEKYFSEHRSKWEV